MNLINQPKVSIIMGIYNCESTLEQSIESIINQTYSNWELIMCDDCSRDNTFKIANEYVKKYPNKIKLIKNKKNITLGPTLNKCINLASGKYIARQDADDISNVNRINKQVEFLEKKQNIDLIGCQMISFNEDGNNGIHRLKENPTRNDLIYGVPFAHPTIIIKSNVIRELKGYSENLQHKQLEDYDLWVRFFEKNYKGYNLKEALYFYREDSKAYERRDNKRRLRQIKFKFKIPKKLSLPIYSYIFIMKDIIALIIPKIVLKYYYKKKITSN